MKKSYNKILITLLCGLAISALAVPVRNGNLKDSQSADTPINDQYHFSAYSFPAKDSLNAESTYSGSVISYRKVMPGNDTLLRRNVKSIYDTNARQNFDQQYSILRFRIDPKDFERLEKSMGVELHTNQYPGERFIGLIKSLRKSDNGADQAEVELMNLPGFVFFPGLKAMGKFRFRS